MYEIEDLRLIHGRIQRDLEAGHCTPDRLKANLAALDLALSTLEGDGAPLEFELSLEGLRYTAGHSPQGRRRHLQVIEGGRP